MVGERVVINGGTYQDIQGTVIESLPDDPEGYIRVYLDMGESRGRLFIADYVTFLSEFEPKVEEASLASTEKTGQQKANTGKKK